MMRRSLLLVGLIALVLALATTGVLSVLRAGEVVEVFPLPPDTLDLPLPTELGSKASVVPQATPVPTSARTSATDRSTTVILQAGRDGYAGCTDTYIQFYRPTDNYCESPELSVVTSNKAATLLRFDLATLPENIIGLNADAVVLEATLDLNAVQGNKGVVMGLYLPYSPWDPCTVVWNAPWEKPGADGPSDREDAPRVQGTVEQATGWMTFDVTELVQHWLREPAQNYGMIIKSLDVSVASHYIFFSCNHPDADVRPRLTIHYEPALLTPVPTATAAAMSTETPTAVRVSTIAPTQAATPAATPVPTPTLILPLSPRVIELRWQNEMDVGGTYPIRVVFRPETEAISSPSQLYLLSVYAHVTAPTFDVVENSPAEQVLELPEDILTWSWQVEPRVVGSQLLSLDLLFSWRPATSTVPALAEESGTWYQTKVIKVIRPFRYWTAMTMLRNLLLAIALLCLVGWYLLRRRTRAESAGD